MQSRTNVALYCIVHVVVNASGCSMTTWNTYSGEFEVINHTKETIWIDDWQGFGRAQPSGGAVTPGTTAGSSVSFPRLDTIPDSTVVTWRVDGSNTKLRQEVSLKGVVPVGASGRTVFVLDEEGHWSVLFHRD